MPSKFRSTIRRARRQAGKIIKKTVKQRYLNSGGGLKLQRIAKDVSILKTLVNAEKEIYTAMNLVAQNVDLTTPYFQPITNVAEGTAHGQRDGESIKLHGFRWNTRFMQQASVTNPLYCKMWLIKYIGPRGATPAISTFLKPDFDGAYSTMSERNEDHYKSYVVLSTSGLVKIPCDAVSGQSQFTLRRKFGKFTRDAHQRYSGVLATTLLTNQMYVLIVTSGGDTATSTGGKIDSQLLISYYDN